MIISEAETRTLTLKNSSVSGVSMKFFSRHTTANTAFSGEQVDLSKVNCKVTLRREGKPQHIIYSDQVKPWVLSSGYYNGQIENVVDSSFTVLKAAASGVDEEIINYFTLNFGGVVNLKGEDSLNVEFHFISGASASTVSNSESFMEFDPIEAIGYEIGTPEISTHSIAASQSREQIELGNDVTGVCFVNYDKTGNLEASSPITSVTLSSDRLNLHDNYYELLAKRSEKFQSDAVADKRDMNFYLYEGLGEEIDTARLDLNMVSGNVNAGKCFIVCYRLHVTPETLSKASAMSDKHESEDIAKVAER